MSNKPLSLSTEEREHQVVEIDGKQYKLATLNDLSFRQSSYMSWASERIQKLMQVEEWSDEVGEELEKLLNDTCRLLLPDVDEETFGKLKDMQKLEIFNFFNEQEGVAGEAPRTDSSE